MVCILFAISLREKNFEHFTGISRKAAKKGKGRKALKAKLDTQCNEITKSLIHKNQGSLIQHSKNYSSPITSTARCTVLSKVLCTSK